MCVLKKVAIIIPLYNAAEYINQLVDNLNNQSCNDFIAIFVDDASSDNTISVLNIALEKANFEHSLFVKDKNGGTGAARNLGIDKSVSQFLLFLDADDLVSSNYVSTLLDKAEREKSELVLASIVRKISDGAEYPQYDTELLEKEISDCLLVASRLDDGPCGELISRSLWDRCKLMFPEGLRAEDLAVMPVLHENAKNMACAFNAIYYYIQTKNSRSRTDGRYFDDIYKSVLHLEGKIRNAEFLAFKMAYNVGYGVIMNAIIHREPNAVLRKYSEWLKLNYRTGKKNKYLICIPWQKRIFIWLSYNQLFCILRIITRVGKYKH